MHLPSRSVNFDFGNAGFATAATLPRHEIYPTNLQLVPIIALDLIVKG